MPCKPSRSSTRDVRVTASGPHNPSSPPWNIMSVSVRGLHSAAPGSLFRSADSVARQPRLTCLRFRLISGLERTRVQHSQTTGTPKRSAGAVDGAPKTVCWSGRGGPRSGSLDRPTGAPIRLVGSTPAGRWIQHLARRLVLVVADTGPPFDPQNVEPLPESVGEEPPKLGGAGLHLVRSYADRLHYAEVDGCNILRLEHDLDPEPVNN